MRMSCAHLEDRAAISAAASRFARNIGFGERACWEIGISVQELVSNIVRHAGRGTLELRWIDQCLEIVAVDEGPGIPDEVVAASSTSQHGLGALRRLMHELEILSTRPGGTYVRARRYRDKAP